MVMNSYIEIKNEIERLENSLKNKNNERKELLLPMFKLIEDNSLNNVLPSNMDKCDPNNLPIRLTILAEEVMINELKDSDKIINEIEKIKRDIVNKNVMQLQEENDIKDMKIKLEERKKYVMSKIPELDKLNDEINKLQDGINRRLRILNEGTLVKEEQKIIREMIDKNVIRINNLEIEKGLIIKEEGLYSDILVITKEEGLLVTEKKEVNPFDKMMELGKSLNEIEDRIDNYEKKLNASIMENNNKEQEENIAYNNINVKNDIIEELKKVDVPRKFDKEIELNIPYEFTIEEVKNENEEDNKLDNYATDNSEIINNDELDDDSLIPVETHSNFLLETKLRLKKGVRIILGLKSLMTKYLLNKKKSKSNDLDEEVISNEEELNNDTKFDFEEIDNDVNFDFEEISNEEEIDNDITYEKTKTKKSSSGLFVKSYDKQVIDKARDNIETARSFLEENEEELSIEQKKLIRDNLALIYVKLNKARNDKNHQRFDLYQDDIEELDSVSNSLLDSVFDYTFPKTKTR